MKKYFYIAIALASICAVSPAFAQPSAAEIRALISKNDFNGAIREALAGVLEPNIKDADRFQLLRIASDAITKRKSALDPALIPLYQKAVDDAGLSNLVRLELLRQLSAVILSQQDGKEFHDMNPAPARVSLADGLKIPNLLPEEKAVALTNIAEGWQREGDEPKARETYAQIPTLDVSDATKTQAWNAIATSWAQDGNREEALKTGEQHQLDMANIYAALDDVAGQTTALEKILGDPNKPENERWAAFQRLPQFAWGQINLLNDAVMLGQKYFPAFAKTDPNRALTFVMRFRLINMRSGLLPDANNPDIANFLAWSGPLLLAASRLSARDYDIVRFKLPNALAILGRAGEAKAAIHEAATDEKVTSKTRLWARLLDAGLAQQNTANLKKVLLPILDKSEDAVSNQDKLWVAREASKTAGHLDNIPLQRALDELSESLLVKRQTARIVCPYSPTAPADVTAWLESPLVKSAKNRGVLDRPYGDNLQFVQKTDVNVRGRGAAGGNAQKSPGELTTDMYTACDERGIFIFLNAHDPQYRAVLEGLTTGGGIEMYMAPGARQPYYFLYADLPKATSDPQDFVTDYPNEHYRALSRKGGTYFFRAEPIQGGFGAVVFLSWDLFADKLPVNGTRWQLEAIRWSRNGGFSFGGSQSVHNRSNFGEIEFDGLDAKALTAIKRRIVTDAVADYRKAIQINAPVGRWADLDLGDPAFYQQIVKPEIDRLQPYADMVTASMSDADVEKIFTEAVPEMRNLEFRIAAARADYLKAKFAEESAQ